MVASQADVTQLIQAYGQGDHRALDRLIPILYQQLRQLAHARLRAERKDHTLNTTGLVHEAYLKLFEFNEVTWENRAHFLATASMVMRRVLVDYANRRRAQKRGGGVRNAELDEELLIPDDYAETLLDLNDALKRLEGVSPRQSQIIAFRYFGGLTAQESADALGVSLSTVEREFRFARAWLAREWQGNIQA